MKNIFFAVLFPLFVFADVNVGDWILYSVRGELSGNNIHGSLKTEIIQYDSLTNKFLIKKTLNIDGMVRLQVLKWYSEYTESILENCEIKGGERENIQVPGGIFDTCRIKKLTNEGYNEDWFGRSPLNGHPKYSIFDKQNNLRGDVELVSFSASFTDLSANSQIIEILK